jgi:hypothetical protein
MRTTRLPIALVLAALVAVAGCGSGSASDAESSTGAATTAPAPSAGGGSPGVEDSAPEGSAIPDGTWARTATMAEATRLGLPPEVAQEHVGVDGETPIELRIAGADWALFMGAEGSEELVLGDRGTSDYDADGRWVATGQSEGCSGCTATFTWSVDGDRLTLEMYDVESSEDPVDVLVTRLVMEGTYTRR